MKTKRIFQMRGLFLMSALVAFCVGCATTQEEVKPIGPAVGWSVKLVQVSRLESLNCLYDDPDLARIERYGSGKKWVQVTVNVKPPSDSRLPVGKISLGNCPLLALAYIAQQNNWAAFKFVSNFDSPPEESKKKNLSEYSLVEAKEVCNFSPSGRGEYLVCSPVFVKKNLKLSGFSRTYVSGNWCPAYKKSKTDSMVERGSVCSLYANPDMIIMELFKDKEINEIVLEIQTLKGLRGLMYPTNFILLFAAPADANDFKLTFGDAVVPVQLTN